MKEKQSWCWPPISARRYKYIKAIEEQNKKLREIAWTQSHVVRAPLARIMGLTHLFEEDTTSDIEKHQLVKQILESAGELDDIIRDIVKKSQQIKIDQT
ncbi:MAG: histidine kinase dimerization/phospho-acceptor domain-containing protein [Owenweeksia sp.]|nr:histidine kinase dimerization/phospho-acceptor domain-containing protein [Owenweeksia sp.]